MNNKDKLFWANTLVALKEFIAADIGKVAMANLAAIEKAAGGKKRLDEADEVLHDARNEASELVSLGMAQVQLEREEFLRDCVVANATLDEERASVEVSRVANAEWNRTVAARADELYMVEAEAKEVRADLDAHVIELDGREDGIVAREANVTAREAAVKVREDYYASAP